MYVVIWKIQLYVNDSNKSLVKADVFSLTEVIVPTFCSV